MRFSTSIMTFFGLLLPNEDVFTTRSCHMAKPHGMAMQQDHRPMLDGKPAVAAAFAIATLLVYTWETILTQETHTPEIRCENISSSKCCKSHGLNIEYRMYRIQIADNFQARIPRQTNFIEQHRNLSLSLSLSLSLPLFFSFSLSLSLSLSLFLSISLSLSLFLSLSLSLSLSLYLSLALSLSLSLYIYIYICACRQLYIYRYVFSWLV